MKKIFIRTVLTTISGLIVLYLLYFAFEIEVAGVFKKSIPVLGFILVLLIIFYSDTKFYWRLKGCQRVKDLVELYNGSSCKLKERIISREAERWIEKGWVNTIDWIMIFNLVKRPYKKKALKYFTSEHFHKDVFETLKDIKVHRLTDGEKEMVSVMLSSNLSQIALATRLEGELAVLLKVYFPKVLMGVAQKYYSNPDIELEEKIESLRLINSKIYLEFADKELAGYLENYLDKDSAASMKRERFYETLPYGSFSESVVRKHFGGGDLNDVGEVANFWNEF